MTSSPGPYPLGPDPHGAGRGHARRDRRGTQEQPPPRPRASRVVALDGLRGWASLVVLVFHCLLLSETFESRSPGMRPHEPSWWLTHTPLSLSWAGVEAVMIFFVLSGFVLSLPTTTTGIVRWRSYYPARLLRLYLPVWASLLLALAAVALVPRGPHPDTTGWYDQHVRPFGLSDVVHDGLLVFGAGWLNSPLWSLQWELLFSLSLPVFVVLARWQRRLWAGKALVLLALVAVAPTVGRWDLGYLSVFGLGVLLAYERDRLGKALRRAKSHRTGRWLATSCVLLLTVEGSLLTADLDAAGLRAAARAVQVLGACCAVVLALHWAPLQRRLESRWAQWLGVRSFSLYLVHEPLVVSSAALWPGLPVVGHLALAVPVSLAVAHVFHRLVESPAHALSRAVARRAAE